MQKSIESKSQQLGNQLTIRLAHSPLTLYTGYKEKPKLQKKMHKK